MSGANRIAAAREDKKWHFATSRACIGALALVGACCSSASAQEAWPSRPIKLVVPLTAGGGVDMTARLAAKHLSDQLGQQVVVENQGGAGGTIAAGMVARSRGDGYTLIYQSVSSAVVNALVYKNLQYDPIKDLTPVTLAVTFPLIVVVNPELPAKDLRELIALLKANPGKYSYGSSGVGTMPHLAGELFKSMAGVDVVHVPYRGNSAIMGDLLAGRVAMMFDGPPTQLGNIQSGKVRALAITTTERSPVLPDVPPVADLLPGYAIPFWTAIFAPANTPKEIVERIAAETNKAMRHPEVVRRYRRDRCRRHRLEPAGARPLLAPAARLSGQDREGRGHQAGGIAARSARSAGRRFAVAQFPPRTLRSAWRRMYVNTRVLFSCTTQRASGSQ